MTDTTGSAPELFVSPDWVRRRRDDLAVVDVRRAWAYEEGHVPGAVSVPFEQFRDPGDETPGKLPTAAAFGQLLGDAGIGPEDTIVAYDDDCGVFASRFLVTAAVFGHDLADLYLLDGDVETWRATGDLTAAEPDPAPATYDPRRVEDGPLVDAASLESALEGEAVVVDTRDEIEYETVHLPGAVNLQWRTLVDDDTHRLKPPADRRAVLEAAGVPPDRPIRLYCNTARRLSFVYAVLRDLGYDDVRFYEGGIDEWAAAGGAVATGSP